MTETDMGIIKHIVKEQLELAALEVLEPVHKGMIKAGNRIHDAVNDTDHEKENKFAGKVKAMQEKDDKGIYLFLKKKKYTWTDKYEVFDADRNIVYYVKGEALSVKRSIKVFDAENRQIGAARESLLALRSPLSAEKLLGNKEPFNCRLEISGMEPVMMKSVLGIAKRKYQINEWGIRIEGNLLGGDLKAYDEENNLILSMPKRNPFQDLYSIRISDKKYELLGLLITLAVNVDFEDGKLEQFNKAVNHQQDEIKRAMRPGWQKKL